jgi:hypothetical protein
MPSYPNQHQMFAFEVLPLLFHNETEKCINLIRKDGNDFLTFWWDRAGVNLDASKRSAPDGLESEIRPYSDGREIALVKLPFPKKSPEAFYLGLVTRPKKLSIWPWRNLARVFALSKTSSDDPQNTVLAELTRTARYVAVGKGPQPSMNAFYKTICDILDKKK